MAKNIAVIGDNESIKGFAAIGLDIFPVTEQDDPAHIFRRIADGDNYAVIYMTEELYGSLSKERARYEDRLTPAVIPIPGVKGNSDTGRRRLSSFVEKAVGSDIIFNN